jgi:hypothetical protein
VLFCAASFVGMFFFLQRQFASYIGAAVAACLAEINGCASGAAESGALLPAAYPNAAATERHQLSH